MTRRLRFAKRLAVLNRAKKPATSRSVGHLTVERFALSESIGDGAAVSGALRSGASLLVFPEGIFRRTAWAPDSWIPRRHEVHVTIGAPIEPAGQDWPEMVRLRDLIRTAIAAEL